jgi:hypothetical protein
VSEDRAQLPSVVDSELPVTTSTLHGALAVPSLAANAGGRASRRHDV